MIRRTIIFALSSILLATALTSSIAGADSTPASGDPSGLKVSPVRTELTMSPGQTQSVPIYITDESNVPVTLQAIVNDFTAQGESGTPSLILNGQNSAHGLKQFIGPIKNITLSPQIQVTVPVNVSIPKKTPGGGYFAAVRFAAVSSSTSSNNVTLSASVASLILVQVNGPGLNQQLSIDSLNVSRGGAGGHFFIGSGGLDADVSFKDSGNVQEAPYGKIVVESGNRIVMSKEVNSPSYPSNVLPGSVRQFSIPLSGLGDFGKYKVDGYFGYGNSSSELLSASTTIYIVSTWIIIVAVVVLVAIITGIIWLVKLLRKRRPPVKPTYRAPQ